MTRKKRYRFAEGHYSYAALERGLATVFDAQSVQTGIVRGRLKRFGTLGMPASKPGKGTRRQYSWEEASQLLLGLLMADAGLDPVVIVPAIMQHWQRFLARKVEGAEDAEPNNPVLLMLRLRATAPWSSGDPLSALPWITIGHRFDVKAGMQHEKHRVQGQRDLVLAQLESDEPGWIAIRDLTAAARKLRAAMDSGSI
jgi:hypothetical protein